MQRWGWRIPFVIGLLIAPAGLLLRRSLQETAEFEAAVSGRRFAATAARSPLGPALREHGQALAVGFGLSVFWAVAVYVLNVYTPVYVQVAFKFTATQAFAASLVGNVLFVATCIAAGGISDHLGRSTVMAASALALLATVLPLYLWIQASPSTGVLVLVLSAFGIMVATYVGVAPAALSDLFPIGIRATSISLVYNLAFTVFGGFAPAILTWFTRESNGSATAPAAYVMSAALVALLTLPFFHRRSAAAGSGAADLVV
jgi:MHS family proline/betaine transporter-like MFS transporter